MMQTDDDVGKVASATPLCISRACELFMEFLVLKSCDRTKAHNAKTMSVEHVKECIVSEPKFDFLRDRAGDLRPDQVQAASAGSAGPAKTHRGSVQQAQHQHQQQQQQQQHHH
eukprot:Opistho-2@90621